METKCTKCYYLFWDVLQIDDIVEITYRCGKPIKTATEKRLATHGIDHDIITVIRKSSKNDLIDDDTIITPEWCEGFKEDDPYELTEEEV